MAEELKHKKNKTNGKCHLSVFLTVLSAQAATGYDLCYSGRACPLGDSKLWPIIQDFAMKEIFLVSRCPS